MTPENGTYLQGFAMVTHKMLSDGDGRNQAAAQTDGRYGNLDPNRGRKQKKGYDRAEQMRRYNNYS